MLSVYLGHSFLSEKTDKIFLAFFGKILHTFLQGFWISQDSLSLHDIAKTRIPVERSPNRDTQQKIDRKPKTEWLSDRGPNTLFFIFEIYTLRRGSLCTLI